MNEPYLTRGSGIKYTPWHCLAPALDVPMRDLKHCML